MTRKRHHNGATKTSDSVDHVQDWHLYRDRIGDRSEIFKLLVDEYGIHRALYAGSYLDLSPSYAIEQVTYVDHDRRAIRFFNEVDTVVTMVKKDTSRTPSIKFIGTSYEEPLPIDDGSVDLLISLFAGFIWEPCQRYLRPSGYFLVNNSHGDAGIATLHKQLELIAVVEYKEGQYHLTKDNLSDYIAPKSGRTPTIDELHKSRRGIAYRKSAFAYVFRLIEAA